MEPKFSDLEAGLLIEEHALDEALASQADLFYRVSKELAELISRKDWAKSNLADVEAKISLNIREGLKDQDKKPTEGEISARVRTSKFVMEANKQLLDLQRKVGSYGALKESFEQRSYALNKLVELYTAGYFGEASHMRATSNVSEHKAGLNRVRMNELRQQAKEGRK